MTITIPTSDHRGSLNVRVWWQYDGRPPQSTHEVDRRRVTKCFVSVRSEAGVVRYTGVTKRRVEHGEWGITDKFSVHVARKNSFARAVATAPLSKEQRELLWQGVLPLVVEQEQ